MSRILALAILLLLSGIPGGMRAETNTPTHNLKELRERLAAQVSDAKFEGAIWGIQVISLDTQTVVFEHQSRKLLSPASNSKLYTIALGLDRLGADYRIRTSIYAQNKPDRRGKISGDLVVYGRGDPTFNARLHGSLEQAFEPLAKSLAAAGVKRITGRLLGDTTYFRGPPYGSGWTWDDPQEYYGAEISALSVNDNSVDVEIRPGAALGKPCVVTLNPPTRMMVISNQTSTVGSGVARNLKLYRVPGSNRVFISGEMPFGDPGYKSELTISNPAELFVELLGKALARQGIKVGGAVATRDWLAGPATDYSGAGWVEIAGVESPPMVDLAREVQKPSQNLYTDLLLAHIGERNRAEQPGTSEELGIRDLNSFLRQAGVPPGDVQFEEGSGLSRNNLTTARATVQLLAYMSRHPCSEAYISALPIAGVDGTLRNRFKNTVAAGNLRAKTGTLRWANSLSGYVKTLAGERLAFALMLNRYVSPDSQSTARAELDRMALLLASYSGRTTESPASNAAVKAGE